MLFIWSIFKSLSDIEELNDKHLLWGMGVAKQIVSLKIEAGEVGCLAPPVYRWSLSYL
ncbi:hypothetical protein GMMP15_1260005 [Candidatus Magnetomoraceae bacterium gMMP-15]